MKRMIDAATWANEKLGELPMVARLLLIGMITIADDQGRLKANPAWLRAQIFPYDDISSDDVGNSLCLIAGNETVLLYEVDGKRYAQLANWWDYQSLQYAQPSKHPRPSGWNDRIRYNYSKGMILSCNWTLADGSKGKDTCDENGVPNQSPEPNSKHNPGGNPGGYPPERINKDQDQIKDQDQDTKRECDPVEPQAPPALASENSLIVSENKLLEPEAAEAVGIDPQTLELSRRWSKNKSAPVRVRMSTQQAALVEAEPAPMFDPPSRVQAASFQPPTDNRVINADEEKIIIPSPVWTEMLGAMLDGLGLRDLASAGVIKAKRDAGGTLETLCKMSPKFRTKDGIQELFSSWARARPDYPVPKPAWLEEHASLFLAGKVRYQDEKRTKQHERRSPGSDGNRAVNAEDLYPEYSRFA